MQGFLHRSQTAAIAVPARPAAPGGWQDLKRDWLRWSRLERIAAECFLAAMLVVVAFTLTIVHIP